MAGTGDSGAESTLDRLGELAWKAIPAIASAIGFVGFVALIGAALQWIRFEAVGLPPTQGLMAMPRQELVITGGWALTVSVLAGLVAALIVYMFDSKGDANVSTARGIVLIATVEVGCILVVVHLNVAGTLLFLAWALAVGALWLCLGEALTPHFTRRRKLKRLRREVLEARLGLLEAGDVGAVADPLPPACSDPPPQDGKPPTTGDAHANYMTAQHRWKRALAEWDAACMAIVWPARQLGVAALTAKVSASTADVLHPPSDLELRPLLERTEAAMGGWVTAVKEWVRTSGGKLGSRIARPLVLLASIIVALGLLVAVVHLNSHNALGFASAGVWMLVIFAVAAVLAVTNMFIAHGTEKFLWYGVSVFFSVVVFGAFLQMARTAHDPSVQPVALLRKGNSAGICGVFITQTSERVYVGRLPYPEYRPGLIFWIPTSEVEAVSVGQLQRPGQAFQERATAMLARLYRDRAEEVPATLKNESETVVQGSEVAAGAKAGRQTTITHERPAKRYDSTPDPTVKVGLTCGSPTEPVTHHDPPSKEKDGPPKPKPVHEKLPPPPPPRPGDG